MASSFAGHRVLGPGAVVLGGSPVLGPQLFEREPPMSVRAMTAVFDHSESRLADRLILLVIADSSADDGTGCFRGKESIARMARVSRTTVTDAIHRLESAGEIEVERRAGRSNLYRITLPGVGQILAGLPGQDSAPGRQAGRPTPGQTGGRDPSGNPSSIREDEERRQAAAERTYAENAARAEAIDADPGIPPPTDLLARLRGREPNGTVSDLQTEADRRGPRVPDATGTRGENADEERTGTE